MLNITELKVISNDLYSSFEYLRVLFTKARGVKKNIYFEINTCLMI